MKWLLCWPPSLLLLVFGLLLDEALGVRVNYQLQRLLVPFEQFGTQCLGGGLRLLNNLGQYPALAQDIGHHSAWISGFKNVSLGPTFVRQDPQAAGMLVVSIFVGGRAPTDCKCMSLCGEIGGLASSTRPRPGPLSISNSGIEDIPLALKASGPFESDTDASQDEPTYISRLYDEDETDESSMLSSEELPCRQQTPPHNTWNIVDALRGLSHSSRQQSGFEGDPAPHERPTVPGATSPDWNRLQDPNVDYDFALELAMGESLRATNYSDHRPPAARVSDTVEAGNIEIKPPGDFIVAPHANAVNSPQLPTEHGGYEFEGDYEFGGDKTLKASFFALDKTQFRPDMLCHSAVGNLRMTLRSLALGLFFVFRIGQCPPAVLPEKYEQWLAAFLNTPSLDQFAPKDDHLWRLRDRLPELKRFVVDYSAIQRWPSRNNPVFLLWDGIADNDVTRCQLIMAMELQDASMIKTALRKFSVHNSGFYPKLPVEDWQYLYRLWGRGDKTLRRLLACHAPPDVRESIVRQGNEQLLQTELLEQANLAPVVLRIPQVDLANADKPSFNTRAGKYTYTLPYRAYVNAVSALVLEQEPPTDYRVEVHAVTSGGLLGTSLDFVDVGGPRRAFLSSLGMLFEQHHAILIDGGCPQRMVLDPRCAPEVYSVLAYTVGMLARSNYFSRGSMLGQCSIRWFLTPAFAEFLFNPDLDRIPTLSDIHNFFPRLQADFDEQHVHVPEDSVQFYDASNRIFFYEDHSHESQLRAETAEQLAVLKNEFLQDIQTRCLMEGHAYFYRTLSKFYSQGMPDYENFELLIVGHELGAEEVINAFEIKAECREYAVIDDRIESNRPTRRVHNLLEAFPELVRDMTPKQRENLFLLTMGSVPVILKSHSVRLEYAGHPMSLHGWSTGSCTGYLVPPRIVAGNGCGQPPSNAYTQLLLALNEQAALDRGSTGGRESRSRLNI